MKNMNWTRKSKIKLSLIILLLVFLSWFLLGERQAELPYRVSGEELLRIKQECRDLAELKLAEEDILYSTIHTPMGHGYSEFGGFCYVEYIREYEEHSAIILYNTTESKEVVRREWPNAINWYKYEFDRFVLGRSRIIDWRAPW